MQRIVLTFGLLAGAVLSAMMFITIPFQDEIGFGSTGMLIGYATMVLAFLLTYFGVRQYRDTVGGGTVTFGRAFKVGLLITVVASVCYVATWQVIYAKFAPDFMEKYQAAAIAKQERAGATEAELEKLRADMAKMGEMYQNPVFRAAITFLEPLPVGLLFTLIAAGVLSRRRKDQQGQPA